MPVCLCRHPTGTFNMGVMHGFGVMRLGNGDTYQGPFVQNTFHGVFGEGEGRAGGRRCQPGSSPCWVRG